MGPAVRLAERYEVTLVRGGHRLAGEAARAALTTLLDRYARLLAGDSTP